MLRYKIIPLLFWALECLASPYVVIETYSEDFFIKNGASRQSENIHSKASNPDWWTRSSKDNSTNRFSTLSTITSENVTSLKQIYIYKGGAYKSQIQASPIFYQGNLVFSLGNLKIVSINPTSKNENWTYTGAKNVAQRGLIADTSKKNHPFIFFSDGDFLVKINGLNGKLLSNFGNNGKVPLGSESVVAPVLDDAYVYTATMTSSVVCVDKVTGQIKWKNDLKNLNSSTGSIWSGISLDSNRGILFITTGNPKPAFDGRDRSRKNDLSNSIIAFRTSDGKILWHFQETRHDLWDLDIASPPILTSIKRLGDSEFIDVVVAPTKSGNTLILDRVKGTPLFNFRLRKAPKSSVKDEITAPYQPDLELPEPFSKPHFTLTDVTNISSESSQYVLKKIKTQGYATGWFPPPKPGTTSITFGIHGGAEWPGPAISDEGIMFVAANHIPWKNSFIYSGSVGVNKTLRQNNAYITYCAYCHESRNGIALELIRSYRDNDAIRKIIKNGYGVMPPVEISSEKVDSILQALNTGSPAITQNRPQVTLAKWEQFLDQRNLPASKPPWGTLNAIDLNSGKLLWKVPLGFYDSLPKNFGSENFGAPMVTKTGLIFISGTPDKLIRAFSAIDGKEIWSHKLPFVGTSAPISFAQNGRQYIAIAASGGGKLAEFTKGQKIETGTSLVIFGIPSAQENLSKIPTKY